MPDRWLGRLHPRYVMYIYKHGNNRRMIFCWYHLRTIEIRQTQSWVIQRRTLKYRDVDTEMYKQVAKIDYKEKNINNNCILKDN